MFGFKKSQKKFTALPMDTELFAAFEAGRLAPQNENEADWYAGVKAGRITPVEGPWY